MDLRNILNPQDSTSQAAESGTHDRSSQSTVSTANRNESQETAWITDEDETQSDVSSDAQEDILFNTPRKHHRYSSATLPSTVPSTTKTNKSTSIPPIILSPTKSRVYTRRVSTSPTRVPILPSPPRRRWSYRSPPPPPAETNNTRFSVFTALLSFAELTLEVAKHLDITDLISLYAISKEFHMLINTRFNSMIYAQWYHKAFESGTVFIHRCYKNLCMRDPAQRINEVRPDEVRFIPSFRWLRMVLWRESVVDDILWSLAAEGHRLPKRVSLVLKKLWFTIDISDNQRRVGLMHNVKFWPNKDIFLATMFFLKLDMRLTCPTTGNGEVGLRRMLLGQRSLSTLARVLRREEMRTQVDMLRMIVRYSYEPRELLDMPILGVPPDEVGRLQYEGWGIRSTKFIPLDELVMSEAVLRKLHLEHHYVEMMIYGYMNKHIWEDVRTPMAKGQLEEMEDSDSDDDEDDDGGVSLPGFEKAGLFEDDNVDEEETEEDGYVEEDTLDLEKLDLKSPPHGRKFKLGNFIGNPGIR